ncbi:MAG: hypothetical protein QNJ97_17965 [Myxococcota bacterium]|nr:hypothetical protein [Myxococcota bacterium]
MSRQAEGVVDRVYDKDFYDEAKGEDIVLYSFKLKNDRNYYRTGEECPVEEGDAVRFSYNSRNNNHNVVMSSFEQIDEEDVQERRPPPRSSGRSNQSRGSTGRSSTQRSGGSSTRRSSGGSSGESSGSSEYWAEKTQHERAVVEPRITWCAARSNAVEIIAAALSHDSGTETKDRILNLGSKKNERLGILLGMVEEVTLQLYARTMDGNFDSTPPVAAEEVSHNEDYDDDE